MHHVMNACGLEQRGRFALLNTETIMIQTNWAVECVALDLFLPALSHAVIYISTHHSDSTRGWGGRWRRRRDRRHGRGGRYGHYCATNQTTFILYCLTRIPEKELESEEDDVDEEGQEYLKMLAKKVNLKANFRNTSVQPHHHCNGSSLHYKYQLQSSY